MTPGDSDVVGADEPAAVDVQSSDRIRERGLQTERFRLNDLLGERDCHRVPGLHDPAVVRLVEFDAVVRGVDVHSGDPADQALGEHFLLRGGGDGHEALRLLQQRLGPRGDDQVAALLGHVRLVQLDLQRQHDLQVEVRRVTGRAAVDGGGQLVADSQRGVAAAGEDVRLRAVDVQARDELVGRVSQLVRGPVFEVGLHVAGGLPLVHVIDGEREVLPLVDEQLLPGVVQLLVADGLVRRVVGDFRVAELRDVDRGTGAGDFTLVIVVDDTAAAENKGFLLGRENDTGPSFRFLLLTACAAGAVISAALSRSHVRPDYIFTRVGCHVHSL
jgi:hypothetical protein